MHNRYTIIKLPNIPQYHRANNTHRYTGSKKIQDSIPVSNNLKYYSSPICGL